MEEYPVMEAGAPSAEEVLHQRLQEQQRKAHEDKMASQEADKRREEEEQQRCEWLRLEVAAECRSTLRRLTEAGYPGGALLPLVTQYTKARHWYGRHYYVGHTTERACWMVYIPDWSTIYLASDGNLYTRTTIYDFRDRRGKQPSGWHKFYPADLDSRNLSKLLDALKNLPKS